MASAATTTPSSQNATGTSNQPAVHAATPQGNLAIDTAATLLSVLQRILTTVNRLETRIDDVEAAQAPVHVQQQLLYWPK
ncbi:hypothetical protein PI124_g16514 [Phytophthora idaei]|nr:hypothetical protein PI126_g22318 [Phytophthora idaei]KAG3238534.1 hypothetical protein PI124_g16514 [Phytophthora idaei]